MAKGPRTKRQQIPSADVEAIGEEMVLRVFKKATTTVLSYVYLTLLYIIISAVVSSTLVAREMRSLYLGYLRSHKHHHILISARQGTGPVASGEALVSRVFRKPQAPTHIDLSSSSSRCCLPDPHTPVYSSTSLTTTRPTDTLIDLLINFKTFFSLLYSFHKYSQ